MTTLSDVSKGSGGYAKQWPHSENILISGSSGLGKSRFAKDLQAELTSLIYKSNSIILLQRQKMERHKDFIDSEYKHKM